VEPKSGNVPTIYCYICQKHLMRPTGRISGSCTWGAVLDSWEYML